MVYERATEKWPEEPKEIKPHPYGIELGMLMDKLRWTELRTLQSFLTSEFSRVGPGTAKEICEHAAILPKTKPFESPLVPIIWRSFAKEAAATQLRISL